MDHRDGQGEPAEGAVGVKPGIREMLGYDDTDPAHAAREITIIDHKRLFMI
jgi:hypothetical protein